jgi:hypothetical protein
MDRATPHTLARTRGGPVGKPERFPVPDGTGDAAICAPRESAGREPGQTRGARSPVDHDQPPDETQDETEPAYILTEGIAYVRGWARAARATTALEKELRACGLTDAMPYLRAEVNAFGVGIIELGRITPETAQALAALLAEARTRPTTAKEDTQHGNAA